MKVLPKIRIGAGTISRLARPPNITKGAWYVVVSCRSCGAPIYLLDDPHAGVDRHRFVGGGRVSAPCHRCGADETYATHEITSIQAEEDVDWVRPARVEPSNMPRQPLTNRYPKVKPTFGPGFLEDRPKAAALVARCIALWTEVEAEEARLLATMLRANTEPAVALFLALQSSRVQFVVLDAVAKVVLNEADYEWFLALMNYGASVEKERNNLAHGRFGGAAEVKEGVLWINAIHLTEHTVRVSATGLTDDALDRVRSNTFVYELSDLETVARDTENLHNQLMSFIGYLVSRHLTPPMTEEWRVARYRELTAEPRIAQALAVIRKRKADEAAREIL